VNTRYATTNPLLGGRPVRHRVFRGFCTLRDAYPAAATLFQQKKDAIYALYNDEIGRLIDRDAARETLEWFDAFYDAIRTPKDAERNVFGNCVGR
jgi:hypothetical protein